MDPTWVRWLECSDDFREGVIIQFYGCDAKVVSIPHNRDDRGEVVREECIRDALVVAGVLWCVGLGDKP